MELDDMNMTDLVAMFAMMGMLARGRGDATTIKEAYRYADVFIRVKQQREEEEQYDDAE